MVTAPSQDQNGNAIFSKTYGDQEWSTQNADVTTYRDGTEIPQVTDAIEWRYLTTGAWCYYDNDPVKENFIIGMLSMVFTIMMKTHQTKNLRQRAGTYPHDAEWTTLEEYLIANEYNYDDTTTESKIAKAMASIQAGLAQQMQAHQARPRV